MEKALLFSDSHGSNEDMINVIKQYAGQVSAVFHMGDIQGAEGLLQNAASEIGCLAYIVRGNCDRNPDLKEANVIGFAGKRITWDRRLAFASYKARRGVSAFFFLSRIRRLITSSAFAPERSSRVLKRP